MATRIGLAALFAAILVPNALGQTQELNDAWHIVIPQTRGFTMERLGRGVEVAGVDARIGIFDETARTTLDISLRNDAAQQVEAVLLLPVPDGAVVSAFDFEGSASEPTARVMPADEARSVYDRIVAKVLDPALLEFAGYNLVRSSVFPVPARGTQKLRLTYEHLLEGDRDRVDYVLPRSESLERHSPWRISVDLQSRTPIATVYSPSHEIVAERRGLSAFSIDLADKTLEPGPFRLSYLRERSGVSASVFAYPDPEVGGGYFLLMAGLPATPNDTSRIKREVTIVIDRSGSMAGSKMDQVKAAALQVIEGLDDGEAFNIIDYATTVASFSPIPVIKDGQTTLGAREYLASLRPAGGTNLHDALLEALRQPVTDETLPIVLFLTDGLPTIGHTSEVKIRAMVEQANSSRRRIFTFGVGADVNVPLLDRLADTTRATASYVLPGEDVELAVVRVFKRLHGPVLAAPSLRTLDRGGEVVTTRVRELIPGALPDLFEGDQLIVLGHYRGDEPITFELSGNLLGERKQFQFTFELETATTRNGFVPRLWASRRIALLVDEIRQAGAVTTGSPTVVGVSWLEGGRYNELLEEIVRLSTKFGVLTEYTAFLATEGTNLSNFEQLVVGCRNELETKAVRKRSGLAALNQGLNYNRQKGQVALNFTNSFIDENLNQARFTAVQQVCDLAFFRRGKRWIDSRLIAVHQIIEPHETLMIGSPEHAELLRRLVREGRQSVVSLAGEILLWVDGRVVLVTDGC